MNESANFSGRFLKRINCLISKVQYLLLILFVSTTWNVAHAQSNLFDPLDQNAIADAAVRADTQMEALRDAPTTAAMEIVKANLSALDGSSVVIALPDGGSIIASHTNTNVRGPSDYSWFANLPNGGTVILVVRDGQITGSIQGLGGQYRITPLVDNLHAITRLDLSKFPPEHPFPPVDRPQPDDGNLVPDGPAPDAGDTAITVDVLVAYTPAAASAAGDILAVIQLAIDESNQAYSQSSANVVLNLVGTMGVNYTETASNAFPNALNAVTNGTGVMAAVHTERDAKAADMVALIISDPAYCGYATLNSTAASAFSVTAWNCATGYYSFAHELGHNFGAHHDPVTSANTVYPYGHGYFYSTQWRTIMSYGAPCSNCPRIPWFSNPNKTYNGQVMGTAAVSDNARVHRERVATVAAFRTRKNQIRDFNGDGLSDILWRHSGGSVGISVMQAGGQSTSWVSLGGPAAGSGWSIVGIGDFNGDGTSDILWRHTSGLMGSWQMTNDAQTVTFAGLGSVAASWFVAGTGDFNGDGRWDILWQSTGGQIGAWLLGAGGQSATWAELGNVSSAWTMQRTGDFNGDGRWDILWRNTSGLIGYWQVGIGAQSITWISLGSVGATWSVQGTGDVNGDGLFDIIWQNTSGTVGSWQIQNSGQSVIWAGIASVEAGWSVQGVGDANNDGRSDILWRNISGAIGNWLVNAGGASVTWAGLGGVSPTWTIKDP